MPLFPPRRLAALDAELGALCDVLGGAARELAEVRRRQAELLDMEAALVVTIEVRLRRVDELLDQRCELTRAADEGAASTARLRPRPAAEPDGSPVVRAHLRPA